MAKVLVSDSLAKQGLEVLEKAAGIEVDYKPGLSEDELAGCIGQYHGLVIRSGSKVTKKVLDSAENLRVVGRAGIGVDNVDVKEASRRGIVVMNTPGGNTVTTAEHAIALMMSMARRIPQATASTKGGKWEKSKFQGSELSEKTLAVIGLGIPLALSRAGILSAAIVLVFWLAGANRKHAMRTLAASAGFVVLLFLTTPGLLGTLKNWFAGWSQDQSISTRTDDYPAVAYYIRRSPIIGRGPSTFLPKFRILDNQWLLQLIEVGVIGAVGFAIYLLLPGFLGRSARHRQPDELWRAMGQALASSSMVAIVASASFDSFTFPMFPGLWAVVLGAAGLLWRASPAPPLAVTAPSPPHEHAP